jgi:hypothetical protein
MTKDKITKEVIEFIKKLPADEQIEFTKDHICNIMIQGPCDGILILRALFPEIYRIMEESKSHILHKTKE